MTPPTRPSRPPSTTPATRSPAAPLDRRPGTADPTGSRDPTSGDAPRPGRPTHLRSHRAAPRPPTTSPARRRPHPRGARLARRPARRRRPRRARARRADRGRGRQRRARPTSQLRDDGVLEVPDDALGIVVVTSEDVRLDDADEVVPLRQLVAVLPGRHRGRHRARRRRPDAAHLVDDDADLDGDGAAAEGLRPRDVTANTARRALGLPSLAEVPPVEDLLARAWLLQVAEEGLARFDTPGRPPRGRTRGARPPRRRRPAVGAVHRRPDDAEADRVPDLGGGAGRRRPR